MRLVDCLLFLKVFHLKILPSSIGTTTQSFVQLGRVLLTNPIFLDSISIATSSTNSDTLLGLIDGVSSVNKKD